MQPRRPLFPGAPPRFIATTGAKFRCKQLTVLQIGPIKMESHIGHFFIKKRFIEKCSTDCSMKSSIKSS